jgi:hypothetical protein
VVGGDKQNRTADLLHAMQALYQLSYTPKNGTAITVYVSILRCTSMQQHLRKKILA